MSQMSFGDAEYAGKRKQTRREVFRSEMEQVVPWKPLLSLIEPFSPVAGRGRHPYRLETLRVHLTQNWFGLSDPAMEEALYEITPMRVFAGLSLSAAIPDETTILNFRRVLETKELAREIMGRVNEYLARKGLLLKRGSHRGRDHHRGAELDQERRRRAGSGDASNQEGQPVALRHEGAYRRGCRLGPGAYSDDHAGQ
jgi:IS5 family transposase